MASTISNRPRLYRILHRAREAGRLVADAAEPPSSSGRSTSSARSSRSPSSPGSPTAIPERFLEYALGLPQRIAVEDGKHVVLFIDEFQEVANPRKPYGDPDVVTKKMRAIFQRSPDVSFLFAGSYEHVLRELFGAPGRRSGTSAASTSSARSRRTRGGRGSWSASTPTRARSTPRRSSACSELGGGHPRTTMLLAQKTHLQSILVGTRTIDATLVELGLRSAMLGDRATLDQTVEQIRLIHRHALLVARRIALGESPYRDLEVRRGVPGAEGPRARRRRRARPARAAGASSSRCSPGYLRELEPFG